MALVHISDPAPASRPCVQGLPDARVDATRAHRQAIEHRRSRTPARRKVCASSSAEVRKCRGREVGDPVAAHHAHAPSRIHTVPSGVAIATCSDLQPTRVEQRLEQQPHFFGPVSAVGPGTIQRDAQPVTPTSASRPAATARRTHDRGLAECRNRPQQPGVSEAPVINADTRATSSAPAIATRRVGAHIEKPDRRRRKLTPSEPPCPTIRTRADSPTRVRSVRFVRAGSRSTRCAYDSASARDAASARADDAVSSRGTGGAVADASALLEVDRIHEPRSDGELSRRLLAEVGRDRGCASR